MAGDILHRDCNATHVDVLMSMLGDIAEFNPLACTCRVAGNGCTRQFMVLTVFNFKPR